MFGVKIGDRVYFDETLPASAFDYGAVLVRKEIAQNAKAPSKETTIAPEPESKGGTERKGRDGEEPELIKAKPSTGVRTLRLRVQVPWDKLSDFVRGVVMPLRADGAQMQVEVVVEAQSVAGGIKPSRLEQKVKETLNQIGAKVLEDSREQ